MRYLHLFVCIPSAEYALFLSFIDIVTHRCCYACVLYDVRYPIGIDPSAGLREHREREIRHSPF